MKKHESKLVLPETNKGVEKGNIRKTQATWLIGSVGRETYKNKQGICISGFFHHYGSGFSFQIKKTHGTDERNLQTCKPYNLGV